MPVSFRVFLVLEGDCIRRISLRRFSEVTRCKVSLAEFAGQRVRYALASVETTSRRASAILRVDYGYLAFDSTGCVDADETMEEIALSFTAYPPMPDTEREPGLINGRPHFARRELAHRFQWMPDARLEESIIEAIMST